MEIVKNTSLDAKMFNFLRASKETTPEQRDIEERTMVMEEAEAVVAEEGEVVVVNANVMKTIKRMAITLIPPVQVEI